jgi:hypothetical protein
VVPAKETDAPCYGHLAAFMRDAPLQQVIALWKAVAAEALAKRASDTKSRQFISTSGFAVPWLHLQNAKVLHN